MATQLTRAAGWRIVNNFLHDMATGTWAACVLVIWVLSLQYGRSVVTAPAFDPVLTGAFRSAQISVLWLLVGALVVLALTGAVRMLYWRREATADELATKRKLLVYKHAAFLVAYGAGSAWAWFLIVR